MSDLNDGGDTILKLGAGLDRELALASGGSMRYLVIDVGAASRSALDSTPQPINLALAIDVSGSMRGRKIDAARRTASGIVAVLTDRDRLSLVSFNGSATLLLPSSTMNDAGRAAAQATVDELVSGGGTNLFDGWMLASEAVARAMLDDSRRSGRVLLLSDGYTNEGTTDQHEIARHVGALLDRGVITSAVGVGNDYDQTLLGAIAEVGGGGLHDAATGDEIEEVVLGELREGRAAVIERLRTSVAVPAGFSAEVLGAWATRSDGGTLEVLCGGLQATQTRRIVIRLKCPAGEVGARVPITIHAFGADIRSGSEVIAHTEIMLCFADSTENEEQPRDVGRTVVVARAWQNHMVRRAMELVATAPPREAEAYLGVELPWFERYAQGVPGCEAMLDDLRFLWRRIGDGVDSRTSKSFYVSSYKGGRSERDLRRAASPTLRERFGDPEPPES